MVARPPTRHSAHIARSRDKVVLFPTTMIALVSLFLISLFLSVADAGLLTTGACYSACNAGWVSCLAAAGVVAGTTGPVGWYAWLTGAPAACSAAQGACMVLCTTTVVIPV